MEWLLVEGKFETKARILGMRLAVARLLPSFVAISKVFSRIVLLTLSLETPK